MRAEKVGNYGGSMAGLVSVLIGFSLALFPDLWIHYFTDDPKAYEVTKYIQIVGPFYAFQGIGLSIFCFSRR